MDEPNVNLPAAQPDIRISDIDNAPIETGAPYSVTPEQYQELLQRFTIVSDERFDLKAKLERLQSRVRTAETLDSLITPYASKAYGYMVGYSIGSGALLTADGFSFKGFHLPDNVLSLLVGSTAVTVIGLVGMVLTGIFVGARKAAGS